jgi:hypothetical protein
MSFTPVEMMSFPPHSEGVVRTDNTKKPDPDDIFGDYDDEDLDDETRLAEQRRRREEEEQKRREEERMRLEG